MLPSPITRIDHVVALVKDVDRAFQTYTDNLGLPVSWTKNEGDGWESAALWLGNASLELLMPLPRSASPMAEFFRSQLEREGAGLFLVGLEPGGMDAAVIELRRRGVQVADPLLGATGRAGTGPARSYRTALISHRFTPGLNSFLCQYDPPFSPLDGGKGALKVKKLDHVVIATADLDDAARLWERNLGLRPDASLNHPLGSGFRVARLPVGDAFVELVQPVSDKGRFAEQFRQRGEGLFSISIEVDDLNEAVAFLRGQNIKVSDPEPSIWPGARLARINHEYSHGVSIQLIERR